MAIGGPLPAYLTQPHWLDSQAVSRDVQVGVHIAQQAQQNRVQQEYRRAQLESLNAYREVQINQILARQQVAKDELTDASLISQWMMDPRQPPPAGLKTPKGIKTVADVQKSYSDTEIGSKFAAANKAFAEKIKDLDATGALRVQDAMDKSGGKMTPEVAGLIDSESARIKSTMADTRVLDEQGQPYEEGSTNRPTFIQSLKTGALHKLPPDWASGMQLIPLKDEQGAIRGYGVPNSSGGITQLRTAKTPGGMDPVLKAAMTAEFAELKRWRETAQSSGGIFGKKVDVEAEYNKRLQSIIDKYQDTPEEAVPSKRVRMKSPDGKIGTIPEDQVDAALKQGFTPVQ